MKNSTTASIVSLFLTLQACSQTVEEELILIEGGSFFMGDVFGEGNPDELPTHQVNISDFFLAPTEVSVAEFEEFVSATGYKTSAEGPYDPEAYGLLMERARSGQLSREGMLALRDEMLRYSGAGYWAAEQREWQGYNPETNWRNPGFEQQQNHPVVAVSWDDAIHFCNWLSVRAGLPSAYDPETGNLLDETGTRTTDLLRVRGYRLPTEAEWEYAARERGRNVRFGFGGDTARSTRMNFRADDAEQPYAVPGLYRKGTTPVGIFPPNALGLYDMSGNAWEWTSDTYVLYDSSARNNPYMAAGSVRVLRGGRWGGDASEARASHRTAWPRNDRCNNSGFRIALSAGER